MFIDVDNTMSWETIFQAIGHPTIILKPDHTIVAANRAAINALKLPPKSIIGHKCYDIFHHSDKYPAMCPLEKLKKTKNLETVDMEIEVLEGTYLISCTPVFKKNGELVQAIHMATNITDRIEAEKALAENFKKMNEVFKNAVRTLGTVVEIRDPYTAGHQKRVTQLACKIAKAISIPENRIEGLYLAGLLHDIGKIAVPAEILTKPSKLTEYEYKLVKDHTRIGYNVLRKIEWPWPVADIVHQHHERLDGSGYNQGLHGEEIILEARILAVADVVEAMSTNRPYRPARTPDVCIDELEKNRGVQYEPDAVDICLDMLKKNELDELFSNI
jgi:putative nucleotidyltransferase with HDIG domain